MAAPRPNAAAPPTAPFPDTAALQPSKALPSGRRDRRPLWTRGARDSGIRTRPKIRQSFALAAISFQTRDPPLLHGGAHARALVGDVRTVEGDLAVAELVHHDRGRGILGVDAVGQALAGRVAVANLRRENGPRLILASGARVCADGRSLRASVPVARARPAHRARVRVETVAGALVVESERAGIVEPQLQCIGRVARKEQRWIAAARLAPAGQTQALWRSQLGQSVVGAGEGDELVGVVDVARLQQSPRLCIEQHQIIVVDPNVAAALQTRLHWHCIQRRAHTCSTVTYGSSSDCWKVNSCSGLGYSHSSTVSG